MDKSLFSESDLELSDSNFGRLLLDKFVLLAWENRGFKPDDVTEQMANLVCDGLISTESNTWRNAGLEKALRLAASGNYEIAGQIGRQNIVASTADRLIARSFVHEIEKRMSGSKAGGVKSAQIKQDENASRNAKICSDRAAGVSAAVLAKRWGRTPGQIRRIIRDANKK